MANLSRIMGHSFQVVPFPGVSTAGSQKFKLLAGRIVNGSTITAVPASDFTITEKSYVWIDTLDDVGDVEVNTSATAEYGMRLIAVVTLSSVSQHVLGDIVVGSAADAMFHVTTRAKEGGGFEYMVDAGGIYLPDNALQAVNATTWATAPTGPIFIKITVTTGTISAIYETTETISDAYAIPSVLVFRIADIDESGKVTQIQFGPMDLTVAEIPNWFLGWKINKDLYRVAKSGTFSWEEKPVNYQFKDGLKSYPQSGETKAHVDGVGQGSITLADSSEETKTYEDDNETLKKMFQLVGDLPLTGDNKLSDREVYGSGTDGTRGWQAISSLVSGGSATFVSSIAYSSSTRKLTYKTRTISLGVNEANKQIQLTVGDEQDDEHAIVVFTAGQCES